MFDFRKLILVAAAAGLGLAGSAYGQLPSITGISGSVDVAAEGQTELLAPLVLNTASNGITTPSSISFTITSTVPFTNQPLSANSTVLDATVMDSNGDPGGTVSQGTSANTVVVTFPSFTPTNPAGTITISNLRVNASQATSPTISVSLGVTSTSGITVSTGSAVVGYLYKTLGTTTIQGAQNVSLQTATTLTTVATVTINGNFPGDFKVGYAGNSTTIANQGTRLAITFSNLNANVNYYVPAVVSNAGLTFAAYPSAVGTTASTALTTPAALVGLVQLPAPVNGSSTVYYGVTATNNADGSVTFNLSELVPNAAAVTSASSVAPSVSVVLVGPSTGTYPQYSSSQTASTAGIAAPYSGTNGNGGLILLPTTTLVFPYVTNAGGFDTGIAITNASAGVGATGLYSSTTLGTSGQFTINFYGSNAPTAPYVSSTATAPGTVGTPFLLSSVAPGFDGYIIVTANFTGAYGFALITNGTITEGYLAKQTNP